MIFSIKNPFNVQIPPTFNNPFIVPIPPIIKSCDKWTGEIEYKGECFNTRTGSITTTRFNRMVCSQPYNTILRNGKCYKY
jgi:hypothetical protein